MRELPKLLAEECVSHLDVVVCTHNDYDHSNGLIGLLERSTISVAELWLPGRFKEALEESAALTPHRVYESLDGEVPMRPDSVPPVVGDAGFEESPLEHITEELAHGHKPIWTLIEPTYRALLRNRDDARRARRVCRHWKALANIRRIADAALRRRVPVRWLEYSVAGPHHRTGDLRALNARRPRRPPLANLGAVLALTLVNREALVLSLDLGPRQGVMFCSDSGLTPFLSSAPPGTGLFTAPHHGSNDRENVAAYPLFDSVPDAVAVRSDKPQEVERSRPCVPYVERQRRFCTRCRGRPTTQVVRLILGEDGWGPDTGVSACRCLAQKRTGT
ncbi:MAG: hypothetical protein SangKO_097430 [Sandaracinaceae bacterium]